MSLLHYLNPQFLVETVGLAGVIFIVFAESGLFFGFFLPGDSLLFTAGFLASQGYMSIALLVLGAPVAAILGDSVGYWFGRKVGQTLFTRDDSFFFRKSHALRAQAFYEKHGSKTIIMARFIPIVRTFAPIVAGVGAMNYQRFLKYNIFGGILWACGASLAGFFLGNAIPGIDHYIVPIVVIIIVVSFIPPAIELWRNRTKKPQ